VLRAVAFAVCLALAAAVPAGATAVVTPSDAGAPWGTADRAGLRADLDALFAADPGVRGAHAGLLAVDPRDGTVLYERLADEAFVPASTLKLLVGAAALAQLGAGYRFHTVALLSAVPVAGVERGPIVVQGGGDPLLGAADLDGLAAAAYAAGVRSFAGAPAVSVDDSLFERAPYPPGWVWDDFPYGYAAPVSAASFEENALHVVARAGSHEGDPAVVTAAGVAVPAAAACPAGAGLRVAAAVTTGRAGTDSTLDAAWPEPGCILLTGAVPAGGSDDLDAAVPNPRARLAGAVRAALVAHGIALSAGDAEGDEPYAGPPAGTVLRPSWAHDSPPLQAMLGTMWENRDNLLAECLLRTLSVYHAGRPGTTADGVAAELDYLKAIGVAPGAVSLHDGSGLSIYDRATPRALVALLSALWKGPTRPTVLAALPVAAVRGTLADAFAGTPAAGRIFAKTGSMMHVRALAGYGATQSHGPVAFALLVDDWDGDPAALGAFRGAVVSRLVR
jgi:D-alanyl-D-alanine carboxypeptidase/D-alanyl-D-alanine-endopeptidase (penicillin-binding protein 4)